MSRPTLIQEAAPVLSLVTLAYWGTCASTASQNEVGAGFWILFGGFYLILVLSLLGFIAAPPWPRGDR